MAPVPQVRQRSSRAAASPCGAGPWRAGCRVSSPRLKVVLVGGLTGPSGRQTDRRRHWAEGGGGDRREEETGQKQGPGDRQGKGLAGGAGASERRMVGSSEQEGCAEAAGEDQTAGMADGALQKTVRWRDKEAQGDRGREGGCQAASTPASSPM